MSRCCFLTSPFRPWLKGLWCAIVPAVRLLFLLLVVFAPLAAVEVPAVVTRVSDGDTIAVMLEGVQPAKVRLLYLDTPESHGNSHGAAMQEGKDAAGYLSQLLLIGTRVVLWGPGKEVEQDRYERRLAVVSIMASEDEPREVVQETMIRAGWSPLWEKYGQADLLWRAKFVTAEERAKAAKAGAWGTAPDYMRDKSNETTAPKR